MYVHSCPKSLTVSVSSPLMVQVLLSQLILCNASQDTFRTSLKTVSLLIVTLDVVLPRTAPDASERVTEKVSGPSAVSSFVTGTIIEPVVEPAAIVKVPEVFV